MGRGVFCVPQDTRTMRDPPDLNVDRGILVNPAMVVQANYSRTQKIKEVPGSPDDRSTGPAGASPRLKSGLGHRIDVAETEEDLLHVAAGECPLTWPPTLAVFDIRRTLRNSSSPASLPSLFASMSSPA